MGKNIFVSLLFDIYFFPNYYHDG